MTISIAEGLQTLWDSTGIMGFIHSFQKAMANTEISGIEQILEAHGQ